LSSADKDNATVTLDKNHYISKITEMFQDKDTYTKINKNPIRKKLVMGCVVYSKNGKTQSIFHYVHTKFIVTVFFRELDSPK